MRRLARNVRLCIVEARPSVLSIFLLRFMAGSALGAAGSHPPDPPGVGIAAAAWTLAVLAVYLYNGITDLHGDRVNGSRRPLARGALRPRFALGVTIGSALLALVTGVTLGPPSTLTVPGLLLAGYLYSGPHLSLKRRWDSAAALVTLAGFGTYYTGYATHARHWVEPDAAVLAIAVVMSLWMGLVGVPTKDLSDVEGDADSGRSNLAMGPGQRRARVAGALSAMLLATVLVGLAATRLPVLALPAGTLAIGAVAVAAVTLSPLSSGSRRRRRRPYRLFMVTQYAVHVGVVLAALAWAP
jgi:4-hydroxybenzoate polyprenyltransferase